MTIKVDFTSEGKVHTLDEYGYIDGECKLKNLPSCQLWFDATEAKYKINNLVFKRSVAISKGCYE